MSQAELDALRDAVYDLTVGWESAYEDNAHDALCVEHARAHCRRCTPDLNTGLFYLLAAQTRRVRMDDARNKGKVTGSPAPWAAEVAGWLTTVAAGARQHEVTLLRALGRRVSERGGSDRNTIRALRALPDLATAVARRLPASPLPKQVAHDVIGWHRTARGRGLLGIEKQNEKRVPLPCSVEGCPALTLWMSTADGSVRCRVCRTRWAESELSWLGRVSGDA